MNKNDKSNILNEVIVAGDLNMDLDVLFFPRSYTPSLKPTAGTTSRSQRGLSAVEAYSKLLLEPRKHLLKSHQHLLHKPPPEAKQEQGEQQARQGAISPSVSVSLQYYVDVVSVIDGKANRICPAFKGIVLLIYSLFSMLSIGITVTKNKNVSNLKIHIITSEGPDRQ